MITYPATRLRHLVFKNALLKPSGSLGFFEHKAPVSLLGPARHFSLLQALMFHLFGLTVCRALALGAWQHVHRRDPFTGLAQTLGELTCGCCPRVRRMGAGPSRVGLKYQGRVDAVRDTQGFFTGPSLL